MNPYSGTCKLPDIQGKSSTKQIRQTIFFKDLNSFRTSVNLPAFNKNKNADCVAKKIVDDLEDNQPCMNPNNSRGNEIKLSDYPKAISKCTIDANTTNDVIVLLVCVSKLVPTHSLRNLTLSPNLNTSHFSIFTIKSSFPPVNPSSQPNHHREPFSSLGQPLMEACNPATS